MRLQDVEISETGELKLDIMELPKNCIFVISGGKVKMAELQPHAETKIFTHQGQVKRVRFEEGEDF